MLLPRSREKISVPRPSMVRHWKPHGRRMRERRVSGLRMD